MQKLYFRVKIGYGENEFISITGDELEKAHYAFLTEKKVILSGTPIRGKDIITITEDWNRAMNYNPEYKITGYDRNEIIKDGVQKLYSGVKELSAKRVQHLMQSNQVQLIGSGVEIPELETPEHKALSEGTKEIANKMSVNKKP